MKEFRVYELVVSKTGPRMKPTAPNSDVDSTLLGRNPVIGVDSAGHAVLPPGARGGGTFDNGVMRMAYKGCTMPDFARQLETMVSVVDGLGLQGVSRIVDKTGLAGSFDFTLEFAFSLGGPGSVGRSEETPSLNDSPAPSLFTAVEQTLGLKLVPTKVQLETLVVDDAERIPTAN